MSKGCNEFCPRAEYLEEWQGGDATDAERAAAAAKLEELRSRMNDCPGRQRLTRDVERPLRFQILRKILGMPTTENATQEIFRCPIDEWPTSEAVLELEGYKPERPNNKF